MTIALSWMPAPALVSSGAQFRAREDGFLEQQFDLKSLLLRGLGLGHRSLGNGAGACCHQPLRRGGAGFRRLWGGAPSHQHV